MTLLPLLILLHPAALAWPARSAWLPLEQGESCDAEYGQAFDVAGDASTGAPWHDLVGERCGVSPAASWYADNEALYFRLRVAAPPGDPEALQSGSWGVLLDLDGSSRTWERLLLLDGASGDLEYWSTRHSEWPEAATDLEHTWPQAFSAGLARIEEAGTSLGGDHDHFLDLALPLADLLAIDSGLDTAPMRAFPATGSGQPGSLEADLGGCDGNSTACTLLETSTLTFSIDQDGDGLTAPEEAALGTLVGDADTDDDGLLDGAEIALGTDPLLCDSDGDGLTDGLEAGVAEPHAHTGQPGCFVADTDPTTTTDPTLADSDGDGVIDGAEDADGDGAVGLWELDPNVVDGDEDLDGDGIPDALEDRCGGADPDDRDGDGLSDEDEGLGHHDQDGDPDWCDDDSDGDGHTDADEGLVDSDDDGDPDCWDLDSDDDGTPDSDEWAPDQDCDGTDARTDPWEQDGPCGDMDGDGVINGKEALCGTDPLDPTSYPTDPSDCFGSTGDRFPHDVFQPSYTGGHFGGGCDSTGGFAPLAGLLATLLLVARRRRVAARVCLPWALLVVAGRAQAQDLDVQLFHPAPDQGVFIGIEDAAHTAEGFGAALGFSYAQNPFVYLYDAPDRSPELVVASLGTLDLQPWWRTGPLRLALDLPMPVVATGSGVSGGQLLGDLALDGKVLLLDRLEGPLGLALRGRITAPTGDPEAWLGSGVPTYAAHLDLATGQRVVTAANLGYATGNGTRLDDLDLGPRLQWGLGLQAPLTDPIFLVLEARGSHLLRSLDVRGAHPVEALLGIRSRPVGPWVGSLGMGTGLSHGVGAPSLRLVTGLAWVPRAPDAPPGLFVDHDRDGMVDEHDACPDQPEDFDGRTDRDGCPDVGQAPLQVVLRDADGQPLPGGTLALLQGERRLDHWRLDDGVLVRSLPTGLQQLELSAPGHHELRFELVLEEAEAMTVLAQPPVRIAQARARSVSSGGGDPDGDSLPAPRDLCPDQPEDPNEQADDDGCPDGYLTTTTISLHDKAGVALPSGQVLLVAGPVTGAWTAPNGLLTRSLVPGEYLLVAQAEGYRPLEQTIAIPEAAAHALTLVLEPAAALAQVLIEVRSASGTPLPARAWAQGPLDLLRATDDAGQLELALPAGVYQLHVASPGYRAHRGVLELEPDTFEPVLLALEPLPPASAQPSGLPALLPRVIPLASTTPSADEEPALRALADSLRAQPEVRLAALEGWVPAGDDRGEPALRSLALAQAAKAWLVQHEGIEEPRLLAVGAGSREPVEGGDLPPQGVEVRAVIFAHQDGGAVERIAP